MPNIISEELKAKIIDLSQQGRSLREIASTLRCSKKTVAMYGGRRENSTAKLLDLIMEELRQIGVDPESIDSLVQLHTIVHTMCLRHPGADPGTNFYADGSCRLCRTASLVKGHKRKKKLAEESVVQSQSNGECVAS